MADGHRGFFLVSRLELVFFLGGAVDFLLVVFFLLDFFAELEELLAEFPAGCLSSSEPRAPLSAASLASLRLRLGNRSLASGAISSMIERTRGENGEHP